MIDECRLSEVIARDSRRMKHVFIVKKGSIDVWKRLDPVHEQSDTTKTTTERIENEKSSLRSSAD